MPGAELLHLRLGHRHLPALDGIRMVAVFLVILFHFGLRGVPGAHGVMIFFVLSGFLITWLLLQEQETTGTVSLRGFYRRRTVRIFPAFYAFWLSVVIVSLIRGKEGSWQPAWSAFFYISNYYSALNGHPENAFSHTWSLSIEEQFYLIWPFVFLLCRQNLQVMTKLLVAVIAVVGIHRAVLSAVFHVNQSYIYSAFDTRIDQLLIGCLLAVSLKRRTVLSFWNVACAHSLMPFLTVGAIASSIFMGPTLLPRYHHVIGFTLEPLLMAVFLAQVIALSSTRVWTWLDAAPVRYLGRISYSLYLYQQVTLYPVRRILAAYPVSVQLVAAVAVTIAVASLSYYFIERPFLQWKHRRPVTRPLEEPAVAV
jgi:peptidoglycan/LPS O-acetylase OafA/YrhL